VEWLAASAAYVLLDRALYMASLRYLPPFYPGGVIFAYHFLSLVVLATIVALVVPPTAWSASLRAVGLHGL
jgi:hypothetical protein